MTGGMKRGFDDRRQRAADARQAAGERASAVRQAAGEQLEQARVAAGELRERVKPRLRGVIHAYAFPVALLAGLILVLLGGSNATERLALGIYAVSLSALLGTSALYHRVDWRRPAVRRWMRRLDHSMIFLLIAGTVTPFAVLLLDGPIATAVLIAVWAGAAAGTIVEAVWIEAPKWISAAVYVGVGLIGAIAFPAIIA
jgi:hemolysin III